MNKIMSLNELIESLINSNAKDFLKVAKNMRLPVKDFDNYIFWKENGYSRNCIIKTYDFELILICWKNGDITPIHGHDAKDCWVYQVDGEMTEIRYKKNTEGELIECNRIDLTPGKLCYMNDSMGYHLLKNESNNTALTLHLYMKPVNKCDAYNPEKDAFEERQLSFDTIGGKPV